jgi:hypothetical protein
LSDEAVVRLITSRFVPVALNLYKIREAQGPGGDFFRSVYKQTAQYQGLWVVAPDGKVLSSHQETRDLSAWRDKVLADLEAGCRAFGEISPRRVPTIEPQPDRGLGLGPDGGATLALTDRAIVVKDLDRDLPRDAIGQVFLDSIALTGAEWAAFGPSDATEGSRLTIPEAVARRFFPVLSPADTTFRSPEEVTVAELTGVVEAVRDGVARLRFEGHIAGIHHGTESEARKGQQCSSEARLLGGLASYDVRNRRLLSLTLVWDGAFRNYPPYHEPPLRFGTVVEWRLSR